MSGYVVRSRGPIVVEDWEVERRFRRSSTLAVRGVRSSVAVLVGDTDSPFGVLAVHYTQTQAAPPDCPTFLDVLANVLAEAIGSRDAQETNRQQALHDGLTGLPNRTLFLDRFIDFPHAAELASAIVQMGHALDLQVIAEGVETAEQAARLQAIGCDVAQGFYFARPTAPEQLTALLAAVTVLTWEPGSCG
jgi:predicted signal transduction protein with EAL and GGDEF domain